MTTSITSLQNPLIRDLRKLKDKKYRQRERQFLIEGHRFVGEALRQAAAVRTILVTEDAPLRDLVIPDSVELIRITPEILRDLTDTVHPQGIAALVDLPAADPAAFAADRGLWLYLDEIRDPGNLGTIIRCAHAFAADGLILSRGCTDPWQDKVLRATMGSIFRVPLLTDQDPAFLEGRIGSGVRLYLADLAEAAPLPGLIPARGSIIVIGNEAHGVCDAIRQLPHQSVRIPMPGEAESLNAAVAAALFLYEWKGRG